MFDVSTYINILSPNIMVAPSSADDLLVIPAIKILTRYGQNYLAQHEQIKLISNAQSVKRTLF